MCVSCDMHMDEVADHDLFFFPFLVYSSVLFTGPVCFLIPLSVPGIQSFPCSVLSLINKVTKNKF